RSSDLNCPLSSSNWPFIDFTASDIHSRLGGLLRGQSGFNFLACQNFVCCWHSRRCCWLPVARVIPILASTFPARVGFRTRIRPGAHRWLVSPLGLPGPWCFRLTTPVRFPPHPA